MFSFIANSGLLILPFVNLAHGAISHTPTCAVPKEEFNWINSPPIRSTFNVLWSCIFTMIICTWNIHNLNIPKVRDPSYVGKMGNVRWHLKKFWYHAKWMIITMIAPEFTFAIAHQRYDAAEDTTKQLRKIANARGVPWTRAHTMFANMGGFVITWNSGRGNADLEGGAFSREQVSQFHLNQKTQFLEAVSSTPSDKSHGRDSPSDFLFHVNAKQIIVLCENNSLNLPYIPEHVLSDLARANFFTKGITGLQIIWVALNIFSRLYHHLPITQLELLVLAFATMSASTYVAQRGCPKDVQHAITFHTLSDTNQDRELFDNLQGFLNSDPKTGKPPANYRRRDIHNGSLPLALSMGGICSTVFLFGWRFAFPSQFERLLWRYTSVYCVAFGILWSVINGQYLAHKIKGLRKHSADTSDTENATTLIADGEMKHSSTMFYCVLVPMSIVYACARLFLIADSSRLLFFSPPQAFVATWVTSLSGFS